MAYNPQLYFPQAYQAPQFPMYQPQQPQAFTPPTIRAEIIQVENEDAAANYPVGAGASQMMIAKDDSAIFIKSATANGSTLEVYTRRPQEAPKPSFDLSEYVRKDEVKALINEAVAPLMAKKKEGIKE
ncbi:MAG: hypothetical protein IJG87_06395 [Ruminococcus sp.]|nr:hypothetical protein [Ruminococcus sp.]